MSVSNVNMITLLIVTLSCIECAGASQVASIWSLA